MMASAGELEHKGSDLMSLKPESWTQVSCPCCHSDQVEPLVLIKLGPKITPATKKWIISRIEARETEGGAHLLAHPGEDSDGDIILVAAPRCTLLRVTEELGLCKPYDDGSMAAFSCHDRDSFKNVDNMQEFLTAAERQYIVKYELDSLHVRKDQHVPGMPLSKGLLRARESIFQKLQKMGVVRSIFPLHEKRSLDDLAKNWYTKKQLWGQPLDSINAYFGGPVAFYFSFLDFYTWSLVLPAFLGLVLAFLPGGEPVGGAEAKQEAEEDEEGPSVRGLAVQAVFSMLWSTVVMELWKRRSSSLSYYWGTLQLTERFAEPRPGFHGTMGYSPITGRLEPLFSEWHRKLRIGLVSVPVVGLFLGMVVLGIAGFYSGEALVQGLHAERGSILTAGLLYVPSLVHILYVNVLGSVYSKVALLLTEYENHREESAFQNHHTAKTLLFTFFNYFAILFHIAFFKQRLAHICRSGRLSSLLIVTQVIGQCTEVLVPYLVDRFISSSDKNLQEDDPEVDRIRVQIGLPPFPGLFSEYIELLVQYGYLSLFSCVYPLTAVFLLINNVTEIRTDAFKICRLFQKPFYAPVSSMGVWQAAFEILGFVSVMSNCWLLLLSPRVKHFCLEGGFSSRNALLFAILVEHVLILIKMILAFVIPDEPDWVRRKRDEIEFRSLHALNELKP
ncbi:anoctamin-10 [Anguilla rostrata]|uniref:anoctamin-10 n=1 Tax=Anguilla rostrata TaxID=7938 RepID=UPI0030D2EAED